MAETRKDPPPAPLSADDYPLAAALLEELNTANAQGAATTATRVTKRLAALGVGPDGQPAAVLQWAAVDGDQVSPPVPPGG
jgi:hypothetical protein